MREREKLLCEARTQIDALFNRTALSQTRYRIFLPEDLASCARTVTALDALAGYHAGHYYWSEAGKSPEALLGAVSEFANRVTETGTTLYSK